MNPHYLPYFVCTSSEGSHKGFIEPTISCAGSYELARHILFHHAQGYAHSSIIMNLLQTMEMTRNKLWCNGMQTAM